MPKSKKMPTLQWALKQKTQKMKNRKNQITQDG